MYTTMKGYIKYTTVLRGREKLVLINIQMLHGCVKNP